MSFQKTLETKIKTKMSFTYKNNKEYPMNISYLNFQEDGQINYYGSDEQGNFNISGRCEGEFIFLKKEQKGKLNVFYAGKLDNNKLYLYYDTVNNITKQISRVNNGEYNAIIELDLTELKNFCYGPENEIYKIFLSNVDTRIFKGNTTNKDEINCGKNFF